MEITNEVLVSVIATTVMSAIAFLVKQFLKKIEESIARVDRHISKLDGKFEAMQGDLRENTVEMAKARSELNAIWRFVDAPKRNSDNGGFDDVDDNR